MKSTTTKKLYIIKVGGSILKNAQRFDNFAKDIASLKARGVQIIIVHGGGPHINKRLLDAKITTPVIEGYRKTTSESISVVEKALFEDVYLPLTKALASYHVEVPTLTAALDIPVYASQKIDKEGQAIWDLVGTATDVDFGLLSTWLSAGLVPVLPSMAKDENGTIYNVNADELASILAAKLSATRLIVLSDTDGIYTDIHDPSTRISLLSPEMASDLIQKGIIHSGMLPKVEHCLKALQGHVEDVYLLSGIQEQALIKACDHTHTVGTRFTMTAQSSVS